VKVGLFLLSEVGENRQELLPKETWHLLGNRRRQPPSDS